MVLRREHLERGRGVDLDHAAEYGDAKDIVAWQKDESRIAAIVPYRLDEFCPDCDNEVPAKSAAAEEASAQPQVPVLEGGSAEVRVEKRKAGEAREGRGR